MVGLTCNEQYYQCVTCGGIHCSDADKIIDLDDYIYYETYCPTCRGVTKHLWVGQDESEINYYYDVTLDKRYYLYNTK